MTITRHPLPENLMSCAAGSMPEPLAAVMACHMVMCPRCQKELSILESVGAVLLEGVKPEPLVSETLSPMLESARNKPIAANATQNDVPEPLQKFVGPSLKDVKWRRVARGIWQYPIPLSNQSNASLRLIKVAPGITLPQHAHSGTELTLVLQGAFTDEFGRYEVGDVVEMDEGVEHAPAVADRTDCVCLVASEGSMQFHSFLAHIVQKLTGF